MIISIQNMQVCLSTVNVAVSTYQCLPTECMQISWLTTKCNSSWHALIMGEQQKWRCFVLWLDTQNFTIAIPLYQILHKRWSLLQRLLDGIKGLPTLTLCFLPCSHTISSSILRRQCLYSCKQEQTSCFPHVWSSGEPRQLLASCEVLGSFQVIRSMCFPTTSLLLPAYCLAAMMTVILVFCFFGGVFALLSSFICMADFH